MEEKFDLLKLDNQLCFPLYACSKEIVRRYTQYLDPLGLTYTQYITLLVLWEYKQMRSRRIGELLYLDSGTLTPVLKRLEEKGLLTRCRAKDDERNLWVCLTEDGEALKQAAAGIPMAVSNGISLERDEAIELHRLLNKMLKQMQE